MNKKRFLGIYLLIIMLLIVLPINDQRSKLNHSYLLTIRMDDICHALLFAPWMWYCPPRLLPNLGGRLAWCAGGLAFGASVELVQYFLPYRTMNVKDLIANCTGVVMGAMAMAVFQKSNHQREKPDHQ